jgi:hypothetical protein
MLPAAIADARETTAGYTTAAHAARDIRRRILEDENAIDALFTPAASR